MGQHHSNSGSTWWRLSERGTVSNWLARCKCWIDVGSSSAVSEFVYVICDALCAIRVSVFVYIGCTTTIHVYSLFSLPSHDRSTDY